MKYFVFCIMNIVLIGSIFAQEDKSKRVSPPAQISQTIDSTSITIDYSRPSLKGRALNTLAPLGKVWRTGANEASWIEISEDVLVEGDTLSQGKYGLFTINQDSTWTIIFNETWDQWGAYNYDASKDVLRVEVAPQTIEEFTEQFTIAIDTNGLVTLLWDKIKVPFLIEKID